MARRYSSSNGYDTLEEYTVGGLPQRGRTPNGLTPSHAITEKQHQNSPTKFWKAVIMIDWLADKKWFRHYLNE